MKAVTDSMGLVEEKIRHLLDYSSTGDVPRYSDIGCWKEK
jgi:hypothetical protein